jgi:hypothetical protein
VSTPEAIVSPTATLVRTAPPAKTQGDQPLCDEAATGGSSGCGGEAERSWGGAGVGGCFEDDADHVSRFDLLILAHGRAPDQRAEHVRSAAHVDDAVVARDVVDLELRDPVAMNLDPSELRGERRKLRRRGAAVGRIGWRGAEIARIERRGAGNLPRPMPRARCVPERVGVRRQAVGRLECVRGASEVTRLERLGALFEAGRRFGSIDGMRLFDRPGRGGRQKERDHVCKNAPTPP